MRVIVQEYQAVAQWRWKIEGREDQEEEDDEDEVCGICRIAYDGCCPDCKQPGDDCPLSEYSACKLARDYMRADIYSVFGKCTHVFHMHCIEKWINTASSNRQCPMDRRPWGAYILQREHLQLLIDLVRLVPAGATETVEA
jgi:anaphase-promoting complex subunit 11